MEDTIYISLNGEANPEIFALHVTRGSYGWRGELEIARRPYFRVRGSTDKQIQTEILDPKSPESIRIDELLQDGVVLTSIPRIQKSELTRYFET